ncbi:MAG TPA: SusC/RagA family TonB-linked outer membrane protein [Gemmatimonadaceae bacterium]|nr:SusC/RagA family TonB-linked outer membrane protein [Gemmatimonadaceae bacterium]
MRFLLVMALGLGIGQTAAAQANDARLTGRVTDPAGQPIGGAQVIVRELGIGSATAENGNYTLVVPASRLTGRPMTVQARAIGYAPILRTVTLAAGNMTQDFQLVRDPLRLEAVVVTGVAEATAANRMGFAVGKVDEAQLREVPAANPIQALGAKVSAARVSTGSGMPGSETSIRLRSATSITPGANNAPLVVVDGVITKSGLADINAQDVESIEVLKGPASAGIYGSDAAAGVINIVTKRGRNAAEGRSIVTLRNEVGTSSLDRRLPLNQSTNCMTRNTAGDDFQRDATGRVVCPSLSLYYDQPYPAKAQFRDQQSSIVGNGQYYSNYVSVSRRAGSTNFQTSFENLHNGGIIDVPGVDLNGITRRNVRLSVDHFLRDNLDLSVGGFFNSSRNQVMTQGAGSPFFSTLLMPPDVDLFAANRNGEPFRVDAGKLGATTSSDPNPLYTLYTTQNHENRTRVQGSFHSQYRPTNWLSFDGNYGYDRNGFDTKSYRPKGYLNTGIVPQGGNLALGSGNVTAQNASVVGAITHTFGTNVNAIFRGSYLFEDEHQTSDFESGSNFGAAGVPTLGNVDPSTRNFGSSEATIRARNWFGQAVFDIAERFNVDGLIRRDGSSLFGPDARYRNFYRATGSYLVSRDLEIPAIDELRLRLSRGTAGLRPPFNAQYETFTIQGGQIIPGVLGNRNLKPAYATETEGGFNIGLMKRVSLEYTYSQKVTTDQVLPVPLSSVNGFGLQYQNAGTITGNTHEMGIGLVLVESPTMSWRVNVTGDRTRQTVTKLNVAPFRFGAGCGANLNQCAAGAGQSSDVFLIKEGETLGAMYGTRWVRTCAELQVSQPTVNCGLYSQNADGLLTLTADHGTAAETPIKFIDAAGSNTVKIGDANADFAAGFSSNLAWNGFTFYGVLDMVQGGNIYNLPRQWLNRAEFRAAEVDQAGRPADQKIAAAYYAKINDANIASDWFVEDGSYTKLRELSVGYALTPGMLQDLRLNRFASSIRLSLIGRNLLTWTNYSGMDPEISAVSAVQGTGSSQGVGDPTIFRLDSFGYPNFRTFSFMFEIGM